MFKIQLTLFDHNNRKIRTVGPVSSVNRKIFFGNPRTNILYINHAGETILRVHQLPIDIKNPDNIWIRDWYLQTTYPDEHVTRGDILLHPGDKIIARHWDKSKFFIEREITIGSD